jgi:hypothetical protein
VRIERLVGTDAVDCGQLGALPMPPDHPIRYVERQIACGAEALKAKKTFWAIQHQPSLDSMIATGLVGDAGGKMYRFAYDSAPCGGPHCEPRFIVEACPVPIEADQQLACRPR